ncbi:MAG TPA: hypothetical protein VGG72_07540 [Bryobacteraceae bacterium]
MAKRKSPELFADPGRDNVPPKSSAYDALFALNQNVEQALQNLERLRQLGIFETRFRRQSLKACRATIEETRAWINFETTECLHEREQHDWVRFGSVRRQWDDKYSDPHDALLNAEKLTRKLTKKNRAK